MGSASRPSSLRQYRRRIRALFALIVLILPIQMWMSFTGREPFPAIMMPRFTWQTINDGIVRWEDVTIHVRFADARSVPMNKHRLLEAMHLPQRMKVLKRVFGWESESPVRPDVRDWLAGRVVSLTGRDDAQSVSFQWHRMISDLNTGEQDVPVEDLGTLSVELSPGKAPNPVDGSSGS